MNRHLIFAIAISVSLSTLGIPLQAANEPRPGKMEKTRVVWTNEDLERLRSLDLISIVGQAALVEDASATALASPYVNTQNPEW